MKITGADYLQRLTPGNTLMGKMVFNDQGAVMASAAAQHREMKAPGINYVQEGQGNALAAMLKPGLIEVRYDPRFSDDRVTGIVRKLLACPELVAAKGWRVTYRNKPLTI